MLISMMKNAKARRIMHDTVTENIEKTCERITLKTDALREKLRNGGGDALVGLLTTAINNKLS